MVAICFDSYGDEPSRPESPENIFQNPFDAGQTVVQRCSRFFMGDNPDEHINALKESSIGRSLAQLREKRKIKIERKYSVDINGLSATYHHISGTRIPGVIKVNLLVNALLLGHELRHAWQHLTLPGEVLCPRTPEEKILLDHFLEADGRATEFALTIQMAHSMGIHQRADGRVYGNEYAHNLLACLDPYQKEVLEYDLKKMDEIVASPQKLKQAMRQVFDLWITQVSLAPEVYRQETEKHLGFAKRQGKLEAIFNRYIRGGLSSLPQFTEQGIRPAYVEMLTKSLGELCGMGGNYLTESKGPAFTSEFYTRICDVRLEKAANDTAFRLGL